MVALPNHRWDSAACAGFAAWITPTTAVIGLALSVWIIFDDRARLLPFCAGAIAVILLCAGVLAAQHALVPMVEHILWSGRNYGSANHMIYGSRFGGYAALFLDAGAWEKIGRAFTVPALTLPGDPAAARAVLHLAAT